MTIPFEGVPLHELGALARRVEDAGYDGLWSAESTHYDGFTPLVVAAEHTESVRLVTGIVNVFTRGPALLAQTAAALADVSGGRFVLGLGASSNVIVERWNGVPFERPLRRVEETVAYLRAVLAGERGDGGFRLAAPPAQRVADGVFTNFLPLTRVDQVVDAFGTPDKELACRFFSFHGEHALETAKRTFVAYATVPVYTEFFRWLGFGAELEPVVDAWNAGDRAGAVEVVPEALVRDIFLLGTVDEQRERLTQFGRAGVQTGVLALSTPADDVPRLVDAFAPG
jgi:alkanesulfonate monooxygenase SsuD/methylene tetrahydromethanopterin reductase-like flavin-dependent oxidoreductase (luciferase family)